MKWNEHERPWLNLAGLSSPVQQAEMKLLLAGRWPPLKPLPVFKYESDEYRASIDFDKLRGEWVCHKTSLPSNKVQEFRGGLTEITMALPHGPAEVLAEGAAAEQQEQELEKDASRRLQAIREWRENYENGAFYSDLRNYLSKSQQNEIDESIRLTLTARQLQFSPKNVAYVFDALSKAGGKMATLLVIAQRNKTGQGANLSANAQVVAPDAARHASAEAIHPTRDRRLKMRTTPTSLAYVELGGNNGGTVLNISETGMAVAAADPLLIDDYLPHIRFQLPSTQQHIEISARVVWLGGSKKSVGIRFVDLTGEARSQISNWIASEALAPQFEALTPAPVESIIPATLESFPEGPIGSVFLEQDQPPSPELIAHTTSQASRIVTPEIPDANPPSLAEVLHERVHRNAPVAGLVPRVRTGVVEPSADRIGNSPSRLYVLEISWFHVAAAVFLLAVISLTVGLTVGRVPLGKRLGDTQKSIVAVDATSPALLNRPGETTSQASAPPAADGSRAESSSAQSLNARPEDSANRVAPIGPASRATRSLTDSDIPETSPERKGSTGLIARNAPPPANSQSANSRRTVGPISGEPAKLVPRNVTPATLAARHLSPPSAILVRGPGDGSKPFRLVLPEEPIAASSSFAMTSQLSVLVAPETGFAATHEPSRLQPGGVVSFVWPRYPKPGARHASSETVKVRTTIGELGQVLDIKLLNGSTSLLPAAMSAIRQWHYRPTLLNKRPVQTQQDVTIEYLPPQYLSRVATQHPSRN
jgi:TonB family protein